ncbi:hypothetical protein IFR05_002703 [Cadophora sp. M221]|nr:hypothetical protein IFR05_002703 [Cadophora sp. M221]
MNLAEHIHQYFISLSQSLTLTLLPKPFPPLLVSLEHIVCAKSVTSFQTVSTPEFQKLSKSRAFSVPFCLLEIRKMPPSNDVDLEPDLARLTLANPAKAMGVDITKLPINGSNAPGTSPQILRHIPVRAPKDPFMKRKQPVVRRTLEDLAASGRPDMDQGNDSASATSGAASFSFNSPMEEVMESPPADKFPNLTNPAPYVGPNYGKCPVCLLHDFKICDARLKEAKIRIADAEALVNSKAAKISDELQKTIEWERERNLMKKQMQDKKDKWESEQRLLVKEIQEKSTEWDVQRRGLFKRINDQRQAEAELESMDNAGDETKSQWGYLYVTQDTFKEMKKGLEARVDELQKELSEIKADKKTWIEESEEELSQLRCEDEHALKSKADI